MVNLSPKHIAQIANKTNFIKDNIEKVLRLVDILDMIFSSEYNEKLVLKGGTAINLGYFDLPRLSVDIDLDYTVLSRDKMLSDKENINSFLEQIMHQKGYSFSPYTKMHFALNSYVLTYINNAGNKDNIKVEINYINRIHILDSQKILIKNPIVESEQAISVLDPHELFGSKIAALLSRCKVRDMYDIYTLLHSDINLDPVLLKKCAIFYNCVGGEADIDIADLGIIDGIDRNAVVKGLKPIISKDDKFDYRTAAIEIKEYLKGLLILSEEEKTFVYKFRNKNVYDPHLLFEDSETINAIKEHQMQ